MSETSTFSWWESFSSDSTLIWDDIFSTGRAFDYPHLGVVGVFARECVPEAEGEGQRDQYFPEAGLIGTNPALLLNKVSKCFNDKHTSNCSHPWNLIVAHKYSWDRQLNNWFMKWIL